MLTSLKNSSNQALTWSRLSIWTQCPSVLAVLNLISWGKGRRLPSMKPGKLARPGAESMARTGHLICGSMAPEAMAAVSSGSFRLPTRAWYLLFCPVVVSDVWTRVN